MAIVRPLQNDDFMAVIKYFKITEISNNSNTKIVSIQKFQHLDDQREATHISFPDMDRHALIELEKRNKHDAKKLFTFRS